MDIEKIIKDLIKKISSKFDDFEGIYFYGSRVNTVYKLDSDYDMVFVFKSDYDFAKERELTGMIIDVELENDIFIDHHPMTKEELERNPIFYNEVVNKGLFYAAT